jgi:hypothetical protein
MTLTVMELQLVELACARMFSAWMEAAHREPQDSEERELHAKLAAHYDHLVKRFMQAQETAEE